MAQNGTAAKRLRRETPWPRYTTTDRATLRLDVGPWPVLHDPKREARELLRSMYDVGR